MLVISETTVKTHVARVLAKLGLRDRVQVAVFAHEHGLVNPSHRSDPHKTAHPDTRSTPAPGSFE